MSIPSLPDSVPHDCHGLIRRAVEYWLSIHPADGLPGRQHLDPGDIPELLPNLRLVEVKGDPQQIDVRAAETEQVAFPEQNGAGNRDREAFADFLGAPADASYRAAVETRQPVWRRVAPVNSRNSDDKITERVILPLAANGSDVHMLFVVQVPH